jgi:type VI protein secretion system component VasK
MQKANLYRPLVSKRPARLDLSVKQRLGQALRNYYEAHLTKELPPRLQAVVKELLEEEPPNKVQGSGDYTNLK